MIFKGKDDRRAEPRRAVNAPGVLVAPGLEVGCALLDESRGGLRIRLQRDVPLPEPVVVVDIPAGLAHQGRVVWRKGHEAGLKIAESAPLGVLVPERFTPARDAWRRAGGR